MPVIGVRLPETGITAYAVFLDLLDLRKYYNDDAGVDAFEALVVANWTAAKYCHAASETTAGGYDYSVTIPALGGGLYEVQFFRQVGANPAITDVLLERVVFEWNNVKIVHQSGDAFARLGAPTGASVSADLADVPTVAEFNARTLVAADYTVVSDLGTVQTGDSYDIVTNATYGLSAIHTDVTTATTALAHATYGLSALNDVLTAIKGSGFATAKDSLKIISDSIDTDRGNRG